MKLGTQTASVVNHLQARGVIGQPKAVVGMGVTLLGWTDRDAGTITKVTEVAGSKRVACYIEVVRDNSVLISGSTASESQEYSYTPGKGQPSTFRQLHTGFWEEVRVNELTGKFVKTGGKGLRIGERDTYRDPSF
jgi:hypothetical protein